MNRQASEKKKLRNTLYMYILIQLISKRMAITDNELALGKTFIFTIKCK